ncbi:tetratricopeptide repeat protein [Magnetococcales bacterium HHB-1]
MIASRLFPIVLLMLFFGSIMPAMASYDQALGLIQQGKLTEARKKLLHLARRGHAKAQNALAKLMLEGQGGEKALRGALHWFRKAAKKDSKVAKKYRRGAKIGLPEAQRYMGILYQKGLGVTQNYGRAFYWFKRGADQEDALAQYYLGRLYFKGFGVRKNGRYAEFWLLKSARQGVVKAQTLLAYIYLFGQGVSKDSHKAIQWFHRAAKRGDVLAQRYLSQIYHMGYGTKKSPQKAFSWYKKLASKENDATAQRSMGLFFAYGRGVPQSDEAAALWYEKAARQGDAIAQNNLAVLLERGLAVERLYRRKPEKEILVFGEQHKSEAAIRAAFWYRKAARTLSQAQHNLASLLERGKLGEPDLINALKWYKKAAKSGFLASQLRLAALYEEGIAEGDVPSNQQIAQAIYWFQSAGKQGSAYARRRMAELRHLQDLQKSYINAGTHSVLKKTLTKLGYGASSLSNQEVMASTGGAKIFLDDQSTLWHALKDLGYPKP